MAMNVNAMPQFSMPNLQRQYFLDGLRGWAALNVAIVHIFFDALPPMDIEKMHVQFWWPASGSLSVALFFIVSGFALSINFLQTGDRRALARMAAGRYVRLTIPILAVSSLVSTIFAVGIVTPSEFPPRFTDFFKFELTVENLLRFSLFDVYFNYDPFRSYAGPLWTMSFELIGSAMVFGLLFFVKADYVVKFALPSAVILYVWSPLYALFFVGVICAYYADFIKARISERFAAGLLLVGLVLWKVESANNHLFSVAAACLFVGAMASSVVRTALSNRLSRGLGKLSFPLYLIHAPLIFALGLPIYEQGHNWLSPVITLAACFLFALLFIPVDSAATLASRYFGRLVVRSHR